MLSEFDVPFISCDAILEEMGYDDVEEWADDILNDPYNSKVREFIYGTDQPVLIDWPDDDDADDSANCEDCRRFVFDPNKVAKHFKAAR